jgi:hypothetical protein
MEERQRSCDTVMAVAELLVAGSAAYGGGQRHSFGIVKTNLVSPHYAKRYAVLGFPALCRFPASFSCGQEGASRLRDHGFRRAQPFLAAVCIDEVAVERVLLWPPWPAADPAAKVVLAPEHSPGT